MTGSRQIRFPIATRASNATLACRFRDDDVGVRHTADHAMLHGSVPA